MAIRVNPGFINALDRFGKENIQLCYQCGDCSAVCPHADEFYRFPRKPIRLLQMGLENSAIDAENKKVILLHGNIRGNDYYREVSHD